MEQGQKGEGKRLDDDERKEILEEVRGREEERRILPGGVKKLSPSETVNDSIFKQLVLLQQKRRNLPIWS